MLAVLAGWSLGLANQNEMRPYSCMARPPTVVLLMLEVHPPRLPEEHPTMLLPDCAQLG